MALVVKNPPANAGNMRCGFDSWVRKIPLEKDTPVLLAGESLGTEEPGRLQSIGLQRVRHD